MRASEIDALRRKFEARYPNEPTHEFQPLTDRIRRALSWMDKAYHSRQDSPIRFVELWIALNALYGQQPPYPYTEGRLPKETTAFRDWAKKLARLDSHATLLAALDDIDVDTLVENRYLCHEYWGKDASYGSVVSEDKRVTREERRNGQTVDVLVRIFRRVAVLRNQIVHGSASANTVRNQDAIQPAIRVLSALLLVAVRLMIEKGASERWTPVYPALGTPHHPWP
jgi:hypothetical protein